MFTTNTILLLYLLFGQAHSINVEYLNGGSRLNHSSFMDYIFSCSVTGPTLTWTVNGFRLGGFLPQNIGTILFSFRTGFKYVANLIFLQPTLVYGLYDFVSVLIVSVTTFLELDVVCTNGLSRENTTNKDPINTNQVVNYSDPVYLDYLLSISLPSNNSVYASMFLCGINNSYITWQAKNIKYGFSESSLVGDEKLHLEQDSYTFSQQAILLDHEPYSIITVLYVTSNSDIKVACGFEQKELELSSSFVCCDKFTSESTPLLLNITTINEKSNTIDQTSVEITKESQSNGISTGEISAITGVVVGIFIAVLLFFCVLLILHQRIKSYYDSKTVFDGIEGLLNLESNSSRLKEQQNPEDSQTQENLELDENLEIKSSMIRTPSMPIPRSELCLHHRLNLPSSESSGATSSESSGVPFSASLKQASNETSGKPCEISNESSRRSFEPPSSKTSEVPCIPYSGGENYVLPTSSY